MKKFAVTFLLICCGFIFSGYMKPDVYVIDAVHNAYIHNNLGLDALDDYNYDLALSEFYLAIQLNPNSQATSVYYKNLGLTYMKMGYYQNSLSALERSMKIYNLDFQTYLYLVNVYKKRNMVNRKIAQYKKSKNPIDMVMLGLLYIASGNKSRGITKLDEFCVRQPDLFITPQVREYIRNSLAPRKKHC